MLTINMLATLQPPPSTYKTQTLLEEGESTLRKTPPRSIHVYRHYNIKKNFCEFEINGLELLTIDTFCQINVINWSSCHLKKKKATS